MIFQPAENVAVSGRGRIAELEEQLATAVELLRQAEESVIYHEIDDGPQLHLIQRKERIERFLDEAYDRMGVPDRRKVYVRTF